MAGNYLSAAYGANDVLISLRDVLGEKLNPIFAYDVGLHYVKLIYDVMTMV